MQHIPLLCCASVRVMRTEGGSFVTSVGWLALLSVWVLSEELLQHGVGHMILVALPMAMCCIAGCRQWSGKQPRRTHTFFNSSLADYTATHVWFANALPETLRTRGLLLAPSLFTCFLSGFWNVCGVVTYLRHDDGHWQDRLHQPNK
jgi:hypothetical protein